MSADLDITRSLREQADQATVPPVDIDARRTGGRRHARRRQATVLGAAALVLAVVGGGALAGTDALRTDTEPGPVQRARDVQVGAHASPPSGLVTSVRRSDFSASDAWDLTVPGEQSRTRAISTSDRSS